MQAQRWRAWLTLGAVLLVSGIGGSLLMQRQAEVDGALPHELTIFFSDNTENELYRCGCKVHQYGGLSRKATVIATKDDAPELLVDAGNFSAAQVGQAYDELKTDYLLKIYDRLGYSALNVGSREFNRGKAQLLDLASRSTAPLISANVVGSDRALVLPPYTIATIDDLRIGIVGLITEQYRPDAANSADTLQTLEPLDAFGAFWPDLQRQSDVQVVLSQLRTDEVEMLLKAYPEIDAVIGGPGFDNNTARVEGLPGTVPTAKIGGRGQWLGQVDLAFDVTDRRHVKVESYAQQALHLGEDIPDNTQTEQVLEEFKQRLRDDAPPPQNFDLQLRDAQRGYTGSIYCQDCHGSIYAGWLGTRHGQAFQTLASKGEQNNPGCLECHTTGYAEPDGYVAKGSNYMLANGGCENCHGPGADHLRIADHYAKGLTPLPTDWAIATTHTPADTCQQCHTEDNDPHYVEGVWPYASMLEQVGCAQWTQSTSATP